MKKGEFCLDNFFKHSKTEPETRQNEARYTAERSRRHGGMKLETQQNRARDMAEKYQRRGRMIPNAQGNGGRVTYDMCYLTYEALHIFFLPIFIQSYKLFRLKLALVLGGSFPDTYQLINIFGIFPITAKIKIAHGLI